MVSQIDPTIEKEINALIRDLAQLSFQEYPNIENVGVLNGQSGTALFQFYCAKHFDEDHFADNGVEIISSCIEKINSGYHQSTFCRGIAGFGWTLHHLDENEFTEIDLDELLSPLDEYLFSQMQLELEEGNFDFLHGGMGIGFYFLKRYLSTSQEYLKENYRSYLLKMVRGLDRLAEHHNGMTTWESILNRRTGSKGINIGLSHGMSSIVFVLCHLHRQNIAVEACKKMISGAINFISSLESATNNTLSKFPSWFEKDKPIEYNSRLAWCYGDLGVAMAFENTGHLFQNNELLLKANEIYGKCQPRWSPRQSLVLDAGYCHGSFGNAHIFNKLWHRTKNEEFRKAADHWIMDGIKKHTGHHEEPFKQYRQGEDIWEFELSLLEGITGIGLVLIDYLSESENRWGECLMLH